MRLRLALAAAMALGIGCTTRQSGASSGQSSGTEGTAAASGSSASTGTAGSSSGSTSGSASSTASNSGSGSGSGTGVPRSPYVDGGYVFCAGRMCTPGTYFCNADGTCDQCRSDSDCADSSLPTYDPRLPRCDLDSGIPGYQNTCVQCLGSSDCTGNSSGTQCDLNPNFPPNGLVPRQETLGFETCTRLVTDCRLLDGPDCRINNQICDPATGRCLDRQDSCATDQDCKGQFLVLPHFDVDSMVDPASYVFTGSPYLPQPYCVDGACRPCPEGECPNNNQCFSDTQCGNPAGSPSGPTCDLLTNQCVCTSSAQCSGFWPTCVGLDGGRVNDAGQAIGVCSCGEDSECGDGGLACLPPTKDVSPVWNIFPAIVAPTIFGGQSGSNFCGVRCTSQEFQTCLSLTGWSVCDLNDGLCKGCTTNEECQSSYGSGGPFCGIELNGPSVIGPGREGPPGYCGCIDDAMCPYAYSCTSQVAKPQPGTGNCVPSFSRCLTDDCGTTPFGAPLYCDWDSGSCATLAQHDTAATPSCLSNYDCSEPQVCVAGTCVDCHVDADCAELGKTGETKCCQGGPACNAAGVGRLSTCANVCLIDDECAGNSNGSHCWLRSSAYGNCGCATDADCAGAGDQDGRGGTHCVDEADAGVPEGSCVCATDADCPAGKWCDFGRCYSQCPSTELCPLGSACDSANDCRLRCDNGQACKAPEASCDLGNVMGLNGTGRFGDAGDARWCYACLDSRDCPGGQTCNVGVCGLCYEGSGSCSTGSVCGLDGLCHASCDAGACPTGLVCDAVDQAGYGVDVCFECLSPRDCPDGQGCNSVNHTCGTCTGPTAFGGPYDCPPDAICSNFWHAQVPGICLQNCDRVSCPATAPNCESFPALNTDHAYCFGCTEDEECPDGGWCDLSLNRTFSCQPAAGPGQPD